MSCEFCDGVGGELIWQDAKCRVVRVGDSEYPAYCRVIWREHRKEMTDLAPVDRVHLMHKVFAVENALRELLHPDKVNLASLGNMTPHLHWHVIPRFLDDRHFPQPVWGQVAARPHAVRAAKFDELARRVRAAINEQSGSDIV
jgi:diadenosine tetraphosphate (Ap4A) HIT family hydrolase